MKKLLIYTWLPCLLAMLMSATFTSCSDDDDDETASSGSSSLTSAIIGTWVYEGEDANEGEWEKSETTFKADGTGVAEYWHKYSADGEWIKNGDNETYTYSIDGDKLLMTEIDEERGTQETLVYKIKIEGNKLYMTPFAVYGKDGSYAEIPEGYEVETLVATKK